MKVLQSVPVSMRDGAVLVADVYLPSAEGPVPVVLERTPYGRGEGHFSELAHRICDRGMAFIVQDVRGRGDSGGQFEFMMNPKHEGWDGIDTFEWIRSQEWCNGNVGTVGVSFSAANQQALALEGPSANLRVQVLQDCGTNYYKRMFRQHGACNVGVILPWVASQSHLDYAVSKDPEALAALAEFKADAATWIDRLPLKRGSRPFSLAPAYEDTYFKVLECGDDGPFWQNPLIRLEGRWSEYPSDVALFQISGWFAHHAQANLDKFEHLGGEGKRPFHLIIGPWIHAMEMLESRVAGDVDFGPDAAKFGPWQETWCRWLAAHLVDEKPVEEIDLAPISYFLMGGGDGHRTEAGHLFHGGHWRTSGCWPPADGSPADLYLSAPGALGPEAPPAASASSSFDFDPGDPCPGIGSVSLQEPDEPAFVRPGPWNQWHDPGFAASRGRTGPLRAREDVLTFETEPLEAPLAIAGPVQAKLFVATSAPDTDFVVRLIDAYPPSESYPDGYDLLISDGIVRMRYRDDRVVEDLLTPGEVYELDVELGPTANLFAAGHRLRIDITSSSFPQYDVNPNTGRPLGDYSGMQIAHQTVFHDSAHPSRLVLWALDS